MKQKNCFLAYTFVFFDYRNVNVCWFMYFTVTIYIKICDPHRIRMIFQLILFRTWMSIFRCNEFSLQFSFTISTFLISVHFSLLNWTSVNHVVKHKVLWLKIIIWRRHQSSPPLDFFLNKRFMKWPILLSYGINEPSTDLAIYFRFCESFPLICLDGHFSFPFRFVLFYYFYFISLIFGFNW